MTLRERVQQQHKEEESSDESSDNSEYEEVLKHTLLSVEKPNTCSCGSRISELSRLFWFNSPFFTLRLVQFILLLNSCYITAYSLIYAYVGWQTLYGPVSIALLFLPCLLTFLLLLPNAIPLTTLIYYLDVVAMKEVVETLREMSREIKKQYRQQLALVVKEVMAEEPKIPNHVALKKAKKE